MYLNRHGSGTLNLKEGQDMERLIIILAIFIQSLSSNAHELDSIYEVIKHVETNHEATTIGDSGRAYGIVQIHRICVVDINRIYKTKYTHRQAMDETCSREMFMLYISEGIRLFKKKYCRSPTEGEIVRMWNGGIYRGYRKESTRPYLKRYRKFKKKHSK